MHKIFMHVTGLLNLERPQAAFTTTGFSN